MSNWRLRLSISVLLVSCGCGGDRLPIVSGGTAGRIHNGRDPLIGIQVTVHQLDDDDSEPVAVAASRLDGTFELVTMDGTAACQLASGQYRCTLETAGTPVVIPDEFTSPKTTPLKIELSNDDQMIDLNLPQLANEH